MFAKIIRTTFSTLLLLILTTITAQAQPTNQLFHQSGDPVVGNPNGKITMVEFFDYQCSHCVTMYPVVKSLISKNKDLRVVYKILPLRGAISTLATKAALAAVKQNKFQTFNNALFSSSQNLSEKVIFSLAKSSGLDVNKLKKDMNSSSIKKTIDANMDLARKLKLQGTPTYYFGKTDSKNMDNVNSVLGSVGLRQLQNAVNAAGY